MNKKIMLLAIGVAYNVLPDLVQGPIDDILVDIILFMIATMKRDTKIWQDNFALVQHTSEEKQNTDPIGNYDLKEVQDIAEVEQNGSSIAQYTSEEKQNTDPIGNYDLKEVQDIVEVDQNDITIESEASGDTTESMNTSKVAETIILINAQNVNYVHTNAASDCSENKTTKSANNLESF